jgi:hypothetical protein
MLYLGLGVVNIVDSQEQLAIMFICSATKFGAFFGQQCRETPPCPATPIHHIFGETGGC